MNLLEIRQWFVRESGLWDLCVNPDGGDWTDNGANKYIEAGQKMLDRMLEHNKGTGRFFKLVSADEFTVNFQDCRAIKEAWVVVSGEGRTKLIRKSMEDMRESYPDMDTIESGTPLYYTPAYFRAAPELHLTPIGSVSGYLSYMDVMYTNHYAYNGILFLPPADQEMMIEVWGLFYSTVMTSDSHESWWSVNHPHLLVMAAQCIVEKFNRNSQGVADWTAAIQAEIQTLDFDTAEEDYTDVVRMEG